MSVLSDRDYIIKKPQSSYSTNGKYRFRSQSYSSFFLRCYHDSGTDHPGETEVDVLGIRNETPGQYSKSK